MDNRRHFLSHVISNPLYLGSALECYACENQDSNKDKCIKTTKQCLEHEDICITKIRWGCEYCIVLHFIALHCIALHCIVLYCIVMYNTLYCIALHWIALHCIALYCIVLYCIVLNMKICVLP